MEDRLDLSTSERLRYSRHLILPEVGAQGQRRLKAARLLVVGAGGLGCPVALYLAAAGVGTVGLVDFDTVDLSNLQRQILYATGDEGSSKVVTARERLKGLNPEIEVVAHDEKLTADNVLDIIEPYDIVVDGTDNFGTRYLVNDACVLAGKPNVYGSIYRFEGQASVFSVPGGPCYRCLFADPPPADAVPNCAEGGVLGVMAGLIGTVQATEAIKLILGKGASLIGRLLLLDAMEMRFDTLRVARNPSCPICGDSPTITSVVETAVACASTGGAIADIGARELHDELAAGRPICLLDVRTEEEYDLCHLENATHIPLAQLPSRLDELDPAAGLVVYCKSGTRSRKAIEILADKGFKNLRNLEGGISSWARTVDPAMLVY